MAKGPIDMSTAQHKKYGGKNSGSGGNSGNGSGGYSGGSGGYNSYGSNRAASVSAKPSQPVNLNQYKLVDGAQSRKLYVLVKNPADGTALTALRQIMSKYTGNDQAILVIGQDKKSAIRMPFGIKICDQLTDAATQLLGAECVAVK